MSIPDVADRDCPLASCALSKPTLSSLAVLGEISISGTILKVEELASVLQVCLDSGAKKVLIPNTSAANSEQFRQTSSVRSA